jgi:hypothetical protein
MEKLSNCSHMSWHCLVFNVLTMVSICKPEGMLNNARISILLCQWWVDETVGLLRVGFVQHSTIKYFECRNWRTSCLLIVGEGQTTAVLENLNTETYLHHILAASSLCKLPAVTEWDSECIQRLVNPEPDIHILVTLVGTNKKKTAVLSIKNNFLLIIMAWIFRNRIQIEQELILETGSNEAISSDGESKLDNYGSGDDSR